MVDVLRGKCEPYCGNRDDEPDNYIAWTGWASRMHSQGFKQSRCPKCGYYTIWSK